MLVWLILFQKDSFRKVFLTDKTSPSLKNLNNSRKSEIQFVFLSVLVIFLVDYQIIIKLFYLSKEVFYLSFNNTSSSTVLVLDVADIVMKILTK